MSCGVGHRRGLDLALLWLWCRPATVALIQPIAWEPPYALGEALKRQKQTKKSRLFCIPELTMYFPPFFLEFNTKNLLRQD